MTTISPETALDAIRREIDAIDDQILDLLERRFAATGRVKAAKANDGSIASSPLRPAREAAMLRRLIARREADLSPDILVRLWRVILSASSQSQAPITLHVDERVGHDLDARLSIGQHFCGMEVCVHRTPVKALAALRASWGDLAIFATRSDWADGFALANADSPRVIGTLPVIRGGGEPQLLVLGYAEPRESGDDETLIISPGLPQDVPGALWQAISGSATLTSLPGFLDSEDPHLSKAISRQPGTCIAGRCPRPIKVST